MSQISKSWQLDSRINADTLPITIINDCYVLLANDSRWPWIIVVPTVLGAEEIFDLTAEQQVVVNTLSSTIGEGLKRLTNCEKINIAAIGNSVRQLHIHIVARFEGDANWPKPIWGYSEAQPYSDENAEKLCATLKDIIHAAPLS